ncbi:hypothetical protein [Lacisediminihabitans changchengi]|uniref:Uncharacterized protein n=1 Tax=Lacisediminihabitans changchengi TaxID=2787634 RepID=A0A934W447_9MICO|nr:hypothetical protein [Lacisediminihabitans changchengi]MBK4347130.1 hypothetical protein [Lacisediminihabitans changchengi]
MTPLGDRQRAVDELAPLEPATRGRLQHILLLANQAFSAESAVITVLDKDHQRDLAGTDELDVDLLRELAHMVQHELWPHVADPEAG